ncbi:hypothetical protein BDV93DRAFT_549053 [Ceratobasidium sp. AG-I]|nr:hypothetical protein BDV93DRAFT_549053 [Ceratobasidium sp. AG-I]
MPPPRISIDLLMEFMGPLRHGVSEPAAPPRTMPPAYAFRPVPLNQSLVPLNTTSETNSAQATNQTDAQSQPSGTDHSPTSVTSASTASPLVGTNGHAHIANE